MLNRSGSEAKLFMALECGKKATEDVLGVLRARWVISKQTRICSSLKHLWLYINAFGHHHCTMESLRLKVTENSQEDRSVPFILSFHNLIIENYLWGFISYDIFCLDATVEPWNEFEVAWQISSCLIVVYWHDLGHFGVMENGLTCKEKKNNYQKLFQCLKEAAIPTHFCSRDNHFQLVP